VVAVCNQHGYFDARVVGTQVEPHGKHAVDVTITMDEGKPTLISGVAVQGLETVPSKTAQELRRRLPLWQTPIGPLRAGVGMRLNRLSANGPNGLANPDPGQRFAFHITLGESF